jgi:hypothetical protein
MWCTIVELRPSRGPITYEARVYEGTTRRHTYSAMSEGGARSWLAQQGIPFHKQPRFVTVQRGNK